MVRSALSFTLGVLALLPPSVSMATSDIIDYTKHDERMNAAMAKGQATLPTFDAALERHAEGAILNVRAPYGDSGGNEYLWLNKVSRNADGSYDAIVTNVVERVPNLHKGSPYHAERGSVADWIYHDYRGDHGGWTLRVMRFDMTPEQRALDTMHFVD